MRFVHAIRLDKEWPRPSTPFLGMRTDTKADYNPIMVYVDDKCVNTDELTRIFTAANKSKLHSWPCDGASPRYGQFGLANGALLKEAAKEILSIMLEETVKTVQGPTVPVMTQKQYDQTKAALLLC